MRSTLDKLFSYLSPEKIFVLSVMFVNGLNYLYNLVLGRMLGPEEFAEAALLVTLLLLLSFLATSFQVLSAKFEILFTGEEGQKVRNYIIFLSLMLGILFLLGIFLLAPWLQNILQTSNSSIFRIFALGIPIYFLLSVNRGILQGKQSFERLSITYVSEAVIKFVFSIVLIYWAAMHSSISVSIAILFSLLVAYFPSDLGRIKIKNIKIENTIQRRIIAFFVMALLYELVQVMINSSDIILVKMFFDNKQAGLYASLALIGRVVFFITWMIVMLLLPKVIQAEKEGENSSKILLQYFVGITVFTVVLCLICYFFSEEIVLIMFGEAYVSIHELLYLYSIATSFFALSNVLIYYCLSLDNYTPVYIALFLGALQIGLIYTNHPNLKSVVDIQIGVMAVLFLICLLYVLAWKRKALFS